MIQDSVKDTYKPLGNDLHYLRHITGGSPCAVQIGGHTIEPALLINQNVIATTQKVPESIKAIARSMEADVHAIQNNADLGVFIDRWQKMEKVDESQKP